MMVLIRFWRSRTKKDNVKTVLDMKYNTFFYLNYSFRTFFHGSGFLRIGSGFLADPDPDPDQGKKNQIRNTGFVYNFQIYLKNMDWIRIRMDPGTCLDPDPELG